MEPENVNIPKPEQAQLTIQGKVYEVSLFISALESVELSKLDTDKTDVCIFFIKKIICEHIVGDVHVDINAISEDCCLEYINLFLKANPNIDLIFQKKDNNIPIIKRFILAQNESWEKMVENIQPTLLCISEMVRKMIEEWQNNIEPVMKSVHLIFDQFQNVYKDLINGFADHAKIIIDAVSEFNNPQLSEEEKARLFDQYRLWGDYGWTSTDFLREELLDYCPSDLSDANKIARRILNKQGVQRLFGRMEELGTINKNDLTELKKSYYSKNYKSCVMISFALVDAKLIRSQGRKNPNRLLGNKGIGKLKKKIDDTDKGIFILSLLVENLFKCLNKMFEDSANFKRQPKIINRHFISHGMLHRKVAQRDAIQAVLLVYNLYYLTDLLDI